MNQNQIKDQIRSEKKKNQIELHTLNKESKFNSIKSWNQLKQTQNQWKTTKPLTILRTVIPKLSSGSNPFSKNSDPSPFFPVKPGLDPDRRCSEPLPGFRVSSRKSPPPLLKPLKAFLAGWNSILLCEAMEEKPLDRGSKWSECPPGWVSDPKLATKLPVIKSSKLVFQRAVELCRISLWFYRLSPLKRWRLGVWGLGVWEAEAFRLLRKRKRKREWEALNPKVVEDFWCTKDYGGPRRRGLVVLFADLPRLDYAYDYDFLDFTTNL